MKDWFAWHKRVFVQVIIGSCIVLACGIPGAFGIFNEQHFIVHDNTQVARVVAMSDALGHGQFPVRIVGGLGYGYGYPIFNFYSPLPYYVASVFVIYGLTPLYATKLMFAIGFLFSGVTMFMATRRLWGMYGAILSGVLYLYAPYHAVNVYIRGAVGEYWAMAFLPMILHAVLGMMLVRTRAVRYLILGIIGYAGVILSHNITAMLTSGILVVGLVYAAVVLVFRNNAHLIRRLLVQATIFMVLGMGLSAFFWLPALAEMRYTQVDKIVGGDAAIANHFLYIDQLWDSPWGHAGSGPGREDGMSFKIGKLHIGLALIGALLVVITNSKKPIKRTLLNKQMIYIVGGLASIVLVSVFMSIGISSFVWNMLPMLELVQFPWRFMIFIILALSVLGGGIGAASTFIKADTGLTTNASLLVVAAIVIFVNTKYFAPQTYFHFPESVYTSHKYLSWNASKISDEYLPKDFRVPSSLEEVNSEHFVSRTGATIQQELTSPHEHAITTNSNQSFELLSNIAYLPGWKAYIDGEQVEHTLVDGFISVTVPSGGHRVTLQFHDTAIRKIANVVSLLSLASVFGIILVTYHRAMKKRKKHA